MYWHDDHPDNIDLQQPPPPHLFPFNKKFSSSTPNQLLRFDKIKDKCKQKRIKRNIALVLSAPRLTGYLIEVPGRG